LKDFLIKQVFWNSVNLLSGLKYPTRVKQSSINTPSLFLHQGKIDDAWKVLLLSESNKNASV
jgi:hypothetical protein